MKGEIKMDKKDVKKDHEVSEETWDIEKLMFSADAFSDCDLNDVSEAGELNLDSISFSEDEDFCNTAKDETMQEEDLMSGRVFKRHRKSKESLIDGRGQRFIHRSEYNSIDEDKIFEPSDQSFYSEDSYKRKFLSFVCECSAEDIEKYMKAICCYTNNVGGRSLYTKVVGSGYPGLYLLFVSLDVPFDAPFVDCFDEKLKAAIKG